MLTAVPIAANGSEVEVGTRVSLFKVNASNEPHQVGTVPYGVTADGERFIVNARVVAEARGTSAASNQIAIVLNWQPDP